MALHYLNYLRYVVSYSDVAETELSLYFFVSSHMQSRFWCELSRSSLNSNSNAHCDGAAIASLYELVKRGAVRANDLTLSNNLKAWSDSSVGRALEIQNQGSRVRIPLASVIFSHFHFQVIILLRINPFIKIPIQFHPIMCSHVKQCSNKEDMRQT